MEQGELIMSPRESGDGGRNPEERTRAASEVSAREAGLGWATSGSKCAVEFGAPFVVQGVVAK
jgi:hypothetical protein